MPVLVRVSRRDQVLDGRAKESQSPQTKTAMTIKHRYQQQGRKWQNEHSHSAQGPTADAFPCPKKEYEDIATQRDYQLAFTQIMLAAGKGGVPRLIDFVEASPPIMVDLSRFIDRWADALGLDKAAAWNFFQAHQLSKPAAVKDPAHLRRYLFFVAKHRVLDLARRRRVLTVSFSAIEDGERKSIFDADALARAREREWLAERREMLAELLQSGTLLAIDQKVLRACLATSRCNQQEIASICECNQSTVSRSLLRVRARLEEEMKMGI